MKTGIEVIENSESQRKYRVKTLDSALDKLKRRKILLRSPIIPYRPRMQFARSSRLFNLPKYQY